VSGLPTRDHGDKTLAFPAATSCCEDRLRHQQLPRIGREFRSLPQPSGAGFALRRRPAAPSPTGGAGRRGCGTRGAHGAAERRGWARHGRDQLGANWGFSAETNANNPAEELVQLSEGDDIGWPYCYYSNDAGRKVLAPEYGGDGRTVGRCAKTKDPAIAFPGHWAPMSLAFYGGTQFGASYAGGLFIAFHGSWNRTPLPQEGFRVVFAPFADGKPTGKYEMFATMNAARFRPVGLAVGKDGALFVSADDNRTIWRIVRR
jgi:glucose/arabinose dehydrogenase